MATAIACFDLSPDSYEGAVGRALGQGNDVDTLAAMAGALSGVRLGLDTVPTPLLDQLEDQHKGSSYIRQLALKLPSWRCGV